MSKKIETELLAENKMKETKFDDYERYREKLQSCINNNSNEIIFNDSIVHAVMVMTSMLFLANKNKYEVKMFCGKFSLFRDRTEEKLRIALSEVEPDDEGKKQIWKDYHTNLFYDLHKALDTFFLNGGKLRLVVAKPIFGLSNEKIWNVIKGALNSGQMTVKHYNNTIGIDHFSVTGNAYRRENSDSEKTALCCFNSEETSSIMNSTFELISTDAQPIKIA